MPDVVAPTNPKQPVQCKTCGKKATGTIPEQRHAGWRVRDLPGPAFGGGIALVCPEHVRGGDW